MQVFRQTTCACSRNRLSWLRIRRFYNGKSGTVASRRAELARRDAGYRRHQRQSLHLRRPFRRAAQTWQLFGS